MTQMAVKTDLADHVLEQYAEKTPKPAEYTTSWGAPVNTRTASMTAGPRGPMMMQDMLYFDELSRFDRERIPERVVHAKGAGAHGFFEVTHDISQYTKAAIFSKVGKQTPMFVRFSVVAPERGGPDTARDLRGFAMKFYTEEGNWDLVANNSPIFFVRDPILFPAFIHSLKRNPKTNLKDMNAFWDFMSSRPESVHQHMMLWSDRGTPDGYRFMHGFGSHTFKLTNKDDGYVYCKFHAISLQGIKNLSAREAEILAGKDPDYATRDLFNAIEAKEYPQWGFFIQVMTEDQAQKHRWNPFDLTKVWPHADFPLIPVGRIVLNKNPTNYFEEVEQVAFSPSHLVPGIEVSPDKMLQGRIFSYRDTAYHRVGVNHMQLPINCPLRAPANIQRDGYMCLLSQGDTPAHHPNSFNGPKPAGPPECPFAVNATVDRYESGDEDNYTQPRIFWEKVLDADHKKRFVENVANGLCMAALPIQERVIQVFSNVHPDIGKGINTQLIKLRGMETQMES